MFSAIHKQISSTSAAFDILSRPEFKEFMHLYKPPATDKDRFVPMQMVKRRNEPCTTGQVACVMAHLLGKPLETVASTTYRNSCTIFNL